MLGFTQKELKSFNKVNNQMFNLPPSKLKKIMNNKGIAKAAREGADMF